MFLKAEIFGAEEVDVLVHGILDKVKVLSTYSYFSYSFFLQISVTFHGLDSLNV